MADEQPQESDAEYKDNVAAPLDVDAAVEALRNGTNGALVLSAIAVGLLFLGWLLFYFLLFMGRGPIG